MSQITKAQNRQFDAEFVVRDKYIVDSTHALPSDVSINIIEVIVATTGFSCTDSTIVSGSASYPAVLAVGTILKGSFTGVKVTGGTLICYSI